MTYITKNFFELPESFTPRSGKKDVIYKQYPVLVILSSAVVCIMTRKKVAEVGMHFHTRIGDHINGSAAVNNPPLKSDIALGYLQDGQRNTPTRMSH